MTLRRSPALQPLCSALLTIALMLAVSMGTAPQARAHTSAKPVHSAQQLSSSYLDELGRPTPALIARLHRLAAQPWLPAEARSLLLTATHFYGGLGDDEGGVPLPDPAPVFTQFYWPTVSGNCMGEDLHSVASAIAVPGPVSIPAPGAEEGQTAFVFTALGTAPAAPPEVAQAITVRWLNLDTLAYGETPLTNHGINPEGPATLSGVGDTGTGTVIAVVNGEIATTEYTCSFIPTVALIEAQPQPATLRK